MTRISSGVGCLLSALLLSAAAAPAGADETATGGDATPTYQGVPTESGGRFGGKAAMHVWAEDLNYYVLGDNRINQIFRFDGNVEQQKAFQDDIEAIVLGYGPDPATVAAKNRLQLTVTQYNAVVENAYLACEASRTPYHTCNRIIASLAPFERAAVTR